MMVVHGYVHFMVDRIRKKHHLKKLKANSCQPTKQTTATPKASRIDLFFFPLGKTSGHLIRICMCPEAGTWSSRAFFNAVDFAHTSRTHLNTFP